MGGPKRPKSSYIWFTQAIRAQMKEEHPDSSVTELAKLFGARWKTMVPAEKVPFEALAAKDKVGAGVVV